MKPAIVAPAMRFIGVADAARSTLFYRDILGFEVRDQQGAIEAVYGPACIHLGAEDYAPND
jgi:catechol 2,3-dioxygenase-like lactoylglutathione lyase family enzyme